MALFTLRTDRLLLRSVRASDAISLAARRSDPEVARYQTWIPPYPLDRAEAVIADVMAMDGPVDGEWWMLTIADLADTTVFGDLVVHLSWSGRTAEIGYTLASEAWGRGYAVEATSTLVEYLFDTIGVTRVEASLHPDNTASAQVLERIGMLFEGHTRSSFWVGDDNSDDWLYGMTRDDSELWRNRSRTQPEMVELVEVTDANLSEVLRLATHRSQQYFATPVPKSLAEALIPPEHEGVVVRPWYRAVRADGDVVGFVMLARSQAGHPEPYLWRLLIDRMHQRRGIGAQVIELVVGQCRDWGDATLLVSWVPGKGSPEPMYLARGFVPTGVIEDGEIEARLTFE
ncbi:MAG TPA: GNAT family N-acetyltransferase [Ilumatobacteraceae bacterium]|nr:GNAT family N-acetyltransferase [Ilumatobacteraceae bacterium]